jgi:division protein CdvB (Snf7/Vps24/ESCRT-III family)
MLEFLGTSQTKINMLRVKNSLGTTCLVDENLDEKMSFKSMKNWDREQKTPLFSNLAGRVHRQEPLKERINQVIYKLKVNQNRLEGANLKTQQHDKALFDKCVQAQVSKDSARATMYANEISEIRKMAKVTLRSELALEQVVLRLETIEEFGDVASLMGPVAGVVRSIRDQITGVIPQVGYELGEISETLNGVVLEVGEATGQSYDMEASGSEAQKILGEANTIAETRMRERFPELPQGAPATTAELTIPR